MTAFARSEYTHDDVTVSIEIRGYNSRYLDLFLKIQPGYTAVEDKIRKVITETISRGRIELKATIQDDLETPEIFSVNEKLAKSYFQALMDLKSRLHLQADIPLELLAKKNGVIESLESEVNIDRIWMVVQKCLENALETFDAMKIIEGRALKKDLASRLSFIETCIFQIESESADMPIIYQEKLRERIFALTNGIVEIDPARIAQEAALLADRSDISEEIVRAKSHLAQCHQLMDAPAPSGRPLNFLIQEFQREFNTMGSKSAKAKISHLVVSAKTELEKLREQIQNIE